MFNVSQLYSIPQFLRAKFYKVNYNERGFITIKEKKKWSAILQSRFVQDITGKNINIFSETLTNDLYWL